MHAIKAECLKPDNLEELAVQRLQNLPFGAGFFAYANIVNAVQRVHEAEFRASRARDKAFASLLQNEEEAI